MSLWEREHAWVHVDRESSPLHDDLRTQLQCQSEAALLRADPSSSVSNRTLAIEDTSMAG
jgi:hypothetical protein